jgi:hypothetical protein
MTGTSLRSTIGSADSPATIARIDATRRAIVPGHLAGRSGRDLLSTVRRARSPSSGFSSCTDTKSVAFEALPGGTGFEKQHHQHPSEGGFMESVLLDVAGHRRSPVTMPGHHSPLAGSHHATGRRSVLGRS